MENFSASPEESALIIALRRFAYAMKEHYLVTASAETGGFHPPGAFIEKLILYEAREAASTAFQVWSWSAGLQGQSLNLDDSVQTQLSQDVLKQSGSVLSTSIYAVINFESLLAQARKEVLR